MLTFPQKPYFTWFDKLVSKYFVKECLRKQNSLFNSILTLLCLHPLQMLVSKAYLAVKIDISSQWDVTNSYIWDFS